MNISTPHTADRVDALDLSLFESIPSQTSQQDRRSLLAIQSAVSSVSGAYSYLEIGSHRGGSIQPHLLDSRCTSIVSIDKRPVEVADARGPKYSYSKENSTERMMGNLRQLMPEGVVKIQTFDADVRELSPAAINPKPTLCFIDGEHTDEAVVRDFRFCRSVLAPSGVITFHDSPIVFWGLGQIIDDLNNKGISFHAYNLPDNLFVIEFGGFSIHEHRLIRGMLIDNYVGYIGGLKAMKPYRDFCNRRPVQAAASIVHRTRKIARRFLS